MVLIHKRVSHVPEKYILRRWRKNVNRCHTKIKVSYNRWSTNIEGQRFDKLSNLMLTVADLASNNEEDYNMMTEFMIDMRKQLEQKKSEGGVGTTVNIFSRTGLTSQDGDSPPKEGNTLIISPQVARSKGRPPCRRKQSKIEEIVRRVKKKKLQKQRIGMTYTLFQ